MSSIPYKNLKPEKTFIIFKSTKQFKLDQIILNLKLKSPELTRNKILLDFFLL